MVDLGTYVIKDLNTGKITPEESFTSACVEEVYDSEHVHDDTLSLSLYLSNRPPGSPSILIIRWWCSNRGA